jgi:signal transduction histidine kinase/ActR/RegA family two-component response regulator
VIFDDELIGQLVLANKRQDYTADDLQNVERLADLYALAVYRRRAQEEREQLTQELRQAQKMEAIGTLAGGIAHDFNNILTPIFGYTEMVQAAQPEGSKSKEHLTEVLKAANRAKDLVQQILTFSRQSEHERKPIKIDTIVKEAIKLLRSSIPTTVEIKQNIAQECGVVLADPTQIHQIVMNLCTNAYHAMREQGGILAVSLTEVEVGPEDYITDLQLAPGAYLRLEVSDTGHGMPPEILEKVFDPYFTTKKQGEGTGMGLAIVHGIVNSQDGKITAYSEPGKGTTFHVYLPCLKTETVAIEAETSEATPGGSERILAVDDEEVIVALQKKMLESLGYKVTTMTSSIDTLKIFQSQPDNYDLLITDMTMPGMTGAELAKKVRAIRPDIPIILYTGFSELINKEKAEAMGVSKYLTKPASIKELAISTREVLDKSKSHST